MNSYTNFAAPPPPPRMRFWTTVTLVAGLTGAAAFGVTWLLVDVFTHKQEAKNPFFRVVELADDTTDPAVWGKNFPLQYDAYKRTVDMQRTRFGGSEAIPRTPSDADPRSLVAQSRLEEDGRLKTMWAGYPFSVDFREERGHAYMLEDQTFTQRHEAAPQPGACLNCHASMVAAYQRAGDGDAFKGFQLINAMSYPEARTLAAHPVACIDCHDPATMALRITRPAFIQGIREYKEQEGVPGYDVNTMATRQEMRAFVCGQCHVEYYFKGKDKQLTYPWSRGLKVDEILAYYDQTDFKDWTHADTGAPVLKAQHPEFEMWNQGIHARSGVACADCHMPYMRVGAHKISDHHVRSPLLNVAHACQTCHKETEQELRDRAETIQARTYRLRSIAMTALVEFIHDIKACRDAGATDSQLEKARLAQRKAQFFLDFVEAENSLGFHAPQESARILAESIDATRQGQVALRDLPMKRPGEDDQAATDEAEDMAAAPRTAAP